MDAYIYSTQIPDYFLVLYRIVEELPLHRKIVGIDTIPFPHEKITGGPWFFKRNGSIYVATAHKSTTSNISDEIIINKNLGEYSWPNCLQETQRLLYPKIEISTHDKIHSRVLQYLCLPSTNEKQNINDERMVLITVTRYNRYVHYWRLHFDETRTGSNGTAMNDTIATTTTTTTISPISCGNIPNADTVASQSYYSKLKIVALPYGLDNYFTRIVEYWNHWWDDYIDNEDDVYMEAYNDESNIIVWDYNIDLNKFKITNRFSLLGQNGSSLQYESLITSNDGQYLLSYSQSEGLGICRLDNYLNKTGSKKVQNYKKIKHCGDLNTDFNTVCLSNDNTLVIQYNRHQSNNCMQFDYLYLHSFDFYTESNTMNIRYDTVSSS